MGLLWGDDARAALQTGTGLPLAGGPGVFTLVRHNHRILTATEAARAWPEALHTFTRPVQAWAGLGSGPLVMGILNATPDSFSDGGDRLDPVTAIEAGLLMLHQGADIIDIGGESTRPGAAVIEPALEQDRVLPVIGALVRAGAVVSADTRNSATMRLALAAGARIVNDVSALSHDPSAAATVAKAGCPVVLMHMRGTPATMKQHADYTDVAVEVTQELSARLHAAKAAGVAPEQMAIDPGFGFAKTAEQNLELMQRLPALCALGRPILAGISRKATIGMLANEPTARNRDPGSVAAALFCLARGARVLRVHDVAATRQAVTVWQGLHAS